VIKKKVCMLGAFAVGKTSLIERYVKRTFTDSYKTTVGVRIYTKHAPLGTEDLDLIIWDLAGEDEIVSVRMEYLRGSAGYVLVADGMRRETLDKAADLHARTRAFLGPAPFVLMVNKADRRREWQIEQERLDALIHDGWDVLRTSAKTGEGVEDAFVRISQKIYAGADRQSAVERS
jgi:small GTP-binding protein